MRLILVGGRHLDDVALIRRALSRVHARHAPDVLIHGGLPALGAAAEDWARARGLHILRYPANWQAFGRRAEAIRNAFMLADSRPDLMLALPGGADTRALVLAALARALPVVDQTGARILRPPAEPDDPDPDPDTPDPDRAPPCGRARPRHPAGSGRISPQKPRPSVPSEAFP